jgi:hypothetical protein
MPRTRYKAYFAGLADWIWAGIITLENNRLLNPR